MATCHDHKRTREINDNQSGVPSKKGRFADIFTKRIDHKEDVTWKEHINDPLFWGPYLAERQWGTVREDYSHDGSW